MLLLLTLLFPPMSLGPPLLLLLLLRSNQVFIKIHICVSSAVEERIQQLLLVYDFVFYRCKLCGKEVWNIIEHRTRCRWTCLRCRWTDKNMFKMQNTAIVQNCPNITIILEKEPLKIKEEAKKIKTGRDPHMVKFLTRPCTTAINVTPI